MTQLGTDKDFSPWFYQNEIVIEEVGAQRSIDSSHVVQVAAHLHANRRKGRAVSVN